MRDSASHNDHPRPTNQRHQRFLPRDAPVAVAEMAVAEATVEPVAENVYEPPKKRMPRKDEDSDSEDEEKVGRYKRLTPKVLKKLIKEQELFKTPELNDKLYIHYHGFEKIEGLEEWTGCVRMPRPPGSFFAPRLLCAHRCSLLSATRRGRRCGAAAAVLAPLTIEGMGVHLL